jgi:hypothetical protein
MSWPLTLSQGSQPWQQPPDNNWMQGHKAWEVLPHKACCNTRPAKQHFAWEAFNMGNWPVPLAQCTPILVQPGKAVRCHGSQRSVWPVKSRIFATVIPKTDACANDVA